MTTAIQSNPVPPGGTTAQQPVPPQNSPMDIAALVEYMTPIVQRFRKQSSPLSVSIKDSVQASSGSLSDAQNLPNVGLGYRIRAEHTTVIGLNNTAVGAQAISVSPWFPWNLMPNTAIGINGGATVYSTDAQTTLMVMSRQKRALFWLTPRGGFGPAVDPSICLVTLGAGITATNSGTSAVGSNLCGIASISIAGATNSPSALTIRWITFEKLALDRDSLLGMFPLQNNSVFCQVNRTLVNQMLGTNQQFPLFVAAGVPATLTATWTNTTKSTYDFWSVPTDPGIYAEMVRNSYQVVQQPNQSINATGPAALIYNIPANIYLIAYHLFAFDGNGTTLPTDNTGFQKTTLNYNAATITPVNEFRNRHRAAQFLDYGDDRGAIMAGYNTWDGEATTEHIAMSDDAGWVDTYSAANPTVSLDVAGTVTTPVRFAITREAVVAGAVQVVGG